MILPAQTIAAACRGNNPLVSPFREKYHAYGFSGGLASCGYDVAVAQDLILYPVTLGFLALRAAGFWRPSFSLASSQERFIVPNDLCFRVMDKSTWIRRGLTVHNTVAEPGWEGYLTLELANQGDQVIRICQGMPIAQIVFYRLEAQTLKPYVGKYQDQKHGPQPAR